MSEYVWIEVHVYFQNEQEMEVHIAHEYLLDLYVQLLFREYKIKQLNIGIHGCVFKNAMV